MDPRNEGDEAPETPDWVSIFSTTFKGASVHLADLETFYALVGFPVPVISHLWTKYGRRCERPGLRRHALNPLDWLIFLSFLRTGLSWAMLSLLWRKPITTLSELVSHTLDQLDRMVDEVRPSVSPPILQSPYL